MTSETATRRSPTYPIMLDLAGRDVLVVGGGPVGERRVAGLLEADAWVTLVAPDATARLADLASAEQIRWHRRAFDPGDVAGRALVFAATGVHSVDAAIVSAARSAGMLANAADDLAHCDFHVPAVTRRGEIVIAVGTGGAAPALAARLRDRIAASLGPEWERFAALLGQMREQVRDRVSDSAERMRVLTRAAHDDRLLAAIARGGGPDAASALAEALAGSARRSEALWPPEPAAAVRAEQGARVSLVGTGPGAPDLLTLRALERIRTADVIVFDDLVDRRVLAHASPHAEFVYCGKRGWRSGPQRPGPELLAQRALEGTGKHVVRLKGGDPNVFSRSSEEFAALDAAGVPCDVVPGVTAALAAAAAAHIPLTQRGVSASVTLVTGTGTSDGENGSENTAPGDLAKLIASGGTIAVYMGLRALPEIAAGLIREGVRSDLPVAVIGACSLPDEAVVRASLSDIAAAAEAAELASPALVILGKVAR